MTRYIILLLTLLLPGCAALDALKAVVPDNKGISVDAQIGDRENTLAAENKEETTTIDDVQGDVTVTKTENTKGESGSQIDQVESIGQLEVINGLSIAEVMMLLVMMIVFALIIPSPFSWGRSKTCRFPVKKK